jgi:hypothetical protein
MRPRQLPQGVLSRWLELDDRCAALQQEALDAEAEVGRLRMLMKSGVGNVTATQFEQARNSFEGVFSDAQRKRARADTQAKLLARTKAWIEAVPNGTQLAVVTPPINGADLTQVRAELKSLREQLKTLQSYPPASSDIEERIGDLVAGWARAARPEVRNYSQGQALAVLWGGDIYGPERGNAVGLFAALFPAELASLVMAAIVREQPLNAIAHAERRSALEHAIDEISYAVAALDDRAGAPPDPLMAAWHVLGVRIAVEEEAAA